MNETKDIGQEIIDEFGQTNERIARAILSEFGGVVDAPTETALRTIAYAIVPTTTLYGSYRLRILDRSDQFALRFEVALMHPDDESGDLQRGEHRSTITGPDRYSPAATFSWSSTGSRTYLDEARQMAAVHDLAIRVGAAIDSGVGLLDLMEGE